MQFLFKNTNLKAEIFDRKYTFSSEEILNKKRGVPKNRSKKLRQWILDESFKWPIWKWAILNVYAPNQILVILKDDI